MLGLAALLGVATAAPAQTRKEIREDRQERREDRKELREDKKELREDKKNGADPKEIAEDKKELRDDKKELKEDRKELRRELKQARRKELREKWGNLTKMPEAQAELKVHARRIARLERARKVADEAGKKEVVARIDKLLEKERARHQKAMEKLKEKGPAATPSAAATPGAVPPGGKP